MKHRPVPQAAYVLTQVLTSVELNSFTPAEGSASVVLNSGNFPQKGFILTPFSQLYSWSEIERSFARSLQKWDKCADEEVLIIVCF